MKRFLERGEKTQLIKKKSLQEVTSFSVLMTSPRKKITPTNVPPREVEFKNKHFSFQGKVSYEYCLESPIKINM